MSLSLFAAVQWALPAICGCLPLATATTLRPAQMCRTTIDKVELAAVTLVVIINSRAEKWAFWIWGVQSQVHATVTATHRRESAMARSCWYSASDLINTMRVRLHHQWLSRQSSKANEGDETLCDIVGCIR